jgi:methionyl-tRNA formyltransferase
VPALHAFAAKVECAFVVTQPDRPAGRGHRLQATPVKLAARELGIATLEPANPRELVETLRTLAADLFALAAYGKIVPRALLDVPRIAALNVHPSLLPLYRGATPLQAQIFDGVIESGVTIIAMDAGIDTGDIVLEEQARIGPRETYGEVHDRFAQLGAQMLAQACGQAAQGGLTRTPQPVAGREADIMRTMTRPLRKADLAVDWTWPARRVVDKVRSLSPNPLARAALAGETCKLVAVHEAVLQERSTTASVAGNVLDGPDLTVACADGVVIIDRLIAPNRGETSGAVYAARRAHALRTASR